MINKHHPCKSGDKQTKTQRDTERGCCTALGGVSARMRQRGVGVEALAARICFAETHTYTWLSAIFQESAGWVEKSK